MCFANAPLNQPVLALLQFGLKQCFQKAKMRTPLAHSLFGQLSGLRCDSG